jgi:hypothetical protein
LVPAVATYGTLRRSSLLDPFFIVIKKVNLKDVFINYPKILPYLGDFFHQIKRG